MPDTAIAGLIRTNIKDSNFERSKRIDEAMTCKLTSENLKRWALNMPALRFAR